MLKTIMEKLCKKKVAIQELGNQINKETKEIIYLESKSKAIHHGIARVDLNKIEQGLFRLNIMYTPRDGIHYHDQLFAIHAIKEMEAIFISAIIEEDK